MCSNWYLLFAPKCPHLCSFSLLYPDIHLFGGAQSSEPGFESCFATVSNIGHFRSLYWRPCRLSCINEYLAIDSGGHVSDWVFARNCCMTRLLPGEAELVSEWTGLPGRAKSVKRFERSNGLDTALYKNYLYLFLQSASQIFQLGDLWHIRLLLMFCWGSTFTPNTYFAMHTTP